VVQRKGNNLETIIQRSQKTYNEILLFVLLHIRRDLRSLEDCEFLNYGNAIGMLETLPHK